MTIHVGVTGSRKGCSAEQRAVLDSRLDELISRAGSQPMFLHHGCCEGVDEQVHEMAVKHGYHIVGHPPSNHKLRAWVERGPYWSPGIDVMLPEKKYLDRDLDIVLAVDLLFVVPDGPPRQRSGTWATNGMAIKRKVRTILIPTSGVIA